MGVNVEALKAKSESSTPEPVPTPVRTGPQLIGHLSLANDEARRTFEEIADNHYQYNTLGRSREELESMTCDCVYEHDEDPPHVACGEGSDCINRLTQVECLPGDCRCKSYCQNQRFQRKQYAPIEIVKTEMKGFGLRAADNIPKDAFIYEYVGDVVSNPSFVKRMRQYAEEGIRHFYFMLLQRDEFIDATKRGGIGRFANHSCSPNCYVAKWTVGDRVRMGIFAKRKIQKHEELTFNYNVDRYGHEAQTCYCGEPQCVGFIGGKTQTDVGAMDDMYLDALGLTDEIERLGLKGNKKRRGKKLDEDYMPAMKPLLEKEVPKFIQAMRSMPKRLLIVKLLTRMQNTDDQAVFRQIMRLRGFSLMTNVMDDYKEDSEVLSLAVSCMSKWPLLSRNKIDDSKISGPVQRCTESDNELLKTAAQKLLDAWSVLETAYRIPKRLKDTDDNSSVTHDFLTPADLFGSAADLRPSKKYKKEFDDAPILDIKPLGYAVQPREAREAPSTPVFVPEEPKEPLIKRPSKAQTASIIAAALATQQAEAAAAAVRAEEEKKKAEAKAEREKRRHERKERERSKKDKAASREANKEKRLLKLVGAVVVKVMSKYKAKLPTETFKKHAKELTHLVAEKEKKTASYKDDKLDALPDEKQAKIKKFAKEYIHKVIHRLEKGKRTSGSGPGSRSGSGVLQSPLTPPSSSIPVTLSTWPTLLSAEGDEAEGDLGMTVEEAMDLSDEESEGDEEEDEESREEKGRGEDEDMLDANLISRGPDEPASTESVEPATPISCEGLTDPRLRLGATWDKNDSGHPSLQQEELMVLS
ncbi:hypothetical protein K488DRAFT_57880 [Vararia minispora EC-137]|uniref:Uncharacterized protein n=1 Tax=Vararia minispora EC-137 TaxID=1314806 RepID=A0ACB8QAH2_9AGAM|nr:hypothetical protein K488DRAFT_57880 [Vararia minispora EC-137]